MERENGSVYVSRYVSYVLWMRECCVGACACEWCSRGGCMRACMCDFHVYVAGVSVGCCVCARVRCLHVCAHACMSRCVHVYCINGKRKYVRVYAYMRDIRKHHSHTYTQCACIYKGTRDKNLQEVRKTNKVK